jgi:sodium-independent sulfate anion transporter 11
MLILGTSKGNLLASPLVSSLTIFTDISSGPTSIMGHLTAQIVADFVQDRLSPQAISGVVAFMMGIYALMTGMFKLGFVQ